MLTESAKRLWCRMRIHPNLDFDTIREVGVGRVVPEYWWGTVIVEANCRTCGLVQWERENQ